MNRKLDIAIIEAIKTIIESTDHEVTYTIHKGDEMSFGRKKNDTVRVEITLRKTIDK
ncbi:MAG: hypothetical protein H5T96_09710 [Tissierellales bacterium]|nr:hypothetical protein [Tissierellales bacterium]